jgi:hypothetical protein
LGRIFRDRGDDLGGADFILWQVAGLEGIIAPGAQCAGLMTSQVRSDHAGGSSRIALMQAIQDGEEACVHSDRAAQVI